MFAKEPAPKQDAARTTAPAPGEQSLSIIAPGMRITGDVETRGVLKVDGEINGSVTGARQVLLGRAGIIRGNVMADEIVVGGSVEGSVAARERLELQATAVVNGDIETRSVVVVEGARINGLVRMGEAVAVEPLRIARA